jgi:hypothetical protein
MAKTITYPIRSQIHAVNTAKNTLEEPKTRGKANIKTETVDIIPLKRDFLDPSSQMAHSTDTPAITEQTVSSVSVSAIIRKKPDKTKAHIHTAKAIPRHLFSWDIALLNIPINITSGELYHKTNTKSIPHAKTK